MSTASVHSLLGKERQANSVPTLNLQSGSTYKKRTEQSRRTAQSFNGFVL